MYLLTLVLLMAVLPAVSVVAERALFPDGELLQLAGKWLVFWAGGVRLVLAGLRQMADPAHTAEHIYATRDAGAKRIAGELGFGTTSIGVLGLLAAVRADWLPPAAIVVGLFYVLAGARHVVSPKRSLHDALAMVFDLAVATALAVFLAASAMGLRL